MRRHLEPAQRTELESYLREIMTDYPKIKNPVLKKQAKKTVLRILDEYDVKPFGDLLK